MKMISPSNRAVDVGQTLSETEYIGMCRREVRRLTDPPFSLSHAAVGPALAHPPACLHGSHTTRPPPSSPGVRRLPPQARRVSRHQGDQRPLHGHGPPDELRQAVRHLVQRLRVGRERASLQSCPHFADHFSHAPLRVVPPGCRAIVRLGNLRQLLQAGCMSVCQAVPMA